MVLETTNLICITSGDVIRMAIGPEDIIHLPLYPLFSLLYTGGVSWDTTAVTTTPVIYYERKGLEEDKMQSFIKDRSQDQTLDEKK